MYSVFLIDKEVHEIVCIEGRKLNTKKYNVGIGNFKLYISLNFISIAIFNCTQQFDIIIVLLYN